MNPLALHHAALSHPPALGPSGPGAPLPRDLEGACRALEKEFATLLFQKMRQAAVPRSGSAGGGFARETAEALLDAQWAELASRGEGLGLARALLQRLAPQEVKSGPPGADQRLEAGADRKEAGHEPERGIGAPGARVGSPGRQEAAGAHPGLPGLPGTAAVRGARPPVAGGEET